MLDQRLQRWANMEPVLQAGGDRSEGRARLGKTGDLHPDQYPLHHPECDPTGAGNEGRRMGMRFNCRKLGTGDQPAAWAATGKAR